MPRPVHGANSRANCDSHRRRNPGVPCPRRGDEPSSTAQPAMMGHANDNGVLARLRIGF